MSLHTLEISEESPSFAKYAKDAAEKPMLITLDGEPVAALVGIEDLDLESLSLSKNPQFLAILERSRESQKKGEGLTSDEVRKRLGL